MLAEFQQQRQAATVRSARRLFSIGAVLFIPFLMPLWLSDNPSLGVTLEFLAIAGGAIAIWLIPQDKPALGVAALLISYGLVAGSALFQFGPNMGVGVLTFSWLMTMAALQPYRWLGVIIMMAVYCLAGALDLLGLVGSHWYLQMNGLEWLRSAALIAGVAIGATLAVGYMKNELAEAWKREAAAVAERSSAELAMMQSQRLEAIGKLAGGVAHDFNNTLAVLVGGIEALPLINDEERRRDLLSHMDQAARSAVATTRQLLALSRQGSEPGRPCNPRKSLEDLIPNLKRLFPETIKIEASLTECPHVPVSGGSLEQAVLNLCLNARDAMPHGGTLKLSCKPLADEVEIRVSDNGAGMEDDTRSQALEEFFTTKQAGTGLGLSMVRKTIEGAGGSMEIESAPGGGTSVCLRLPPIAWDIDAIDEHRTDAAKASADHQILLVEDNASVLKLFEYTLKEAGYAVATARTVDEALEQINSTDCDILVTDAVLPDGEPSRAIRAFRAGGWKPVLVISGYIDSEDLVKDLGHGDYQFLQKPFSGAQLLGALAELLD